MLKNRIFTVLFSIFTVLLIITFSIALPIYVRPFYYAHIDAYNLDEVTGMSEEQIKKGYDEVLDYLILPDKEFSTGDFTYSEEGKSHFEDCKVLFDLNINVLIISVLAVVLLYILKRKKVFTFSRPFGYHISLINGILPILLFATIGGLAALDFDKAFVIFHKIFFYGKENWIFNSYTDPIILALPQQFFLNCGILILSSIIILSISLVIFAVLSKKHNK